MEAIDNLMPSESVAYHIIDNEWDTYSEPEKLQHIASKILSGEVLTFREQAFIINGSQRKQSITEWLGSFTWASDNFMDKINTLRDQIFNGQASKAKALSNLLGCLRAKNQLSVLEVVGISQILLGCQNDSPRLKTLRSKLDGQYVNREDLAKALRSYNDFELPQKDRMGEVVARLYLDGDEYGKANREVIVKFGKYGN